MEFKCNCHNSGINGFTGKCGRCGMTKQSQGVSTSNTSTPYKTIHENKNDLEQFWIFNTTHKDCKKLTEEELVELEETKKIFYKPSSNPNDVISNLDRYSPFNTTELVEDINGKYVLLSDVIKAVSNLFSAKNS